MVGTVNIRTSSIRPFPINCAEMFPSSSKYTSLRQTYQRSVDDESGPEVCPDPGHTGLGGVPALLHHEVPALPGRHRSAAAVVPLATNPASVTLSNQVDNTALHWGESSVSNHNYSWTSSNKLTSKNIIAYYFLQLFKIRNTVTVIRRFYVERAICC